MKSVFCRICAPLFLVLFLYYLHFWVHQLLSKNLQKIPFTEQPAKIAATKRNRTLASSQVLVYNRMPKCSSTSVIHLLYKLAWANKFQMVVNELPARSSENDLRNSTNEIQMVDEVRRLQNHPWSSVYIRHMRNPDWLKHGLQVNLVNMVRDPIQRMMSWFYFIRYKWKSINGKLYR